MNRAIAILMILAAFAVGASIASARGGTTGESRSYVAHLFNLTETNTNYRKVLFTGARSQLVVMSIPPGESIGAETHAHVEQTIIVLKGSGQAVLGAQKTNVNDGDVIVVTPGTPHNLVNTGRVPLQVFTTYAPPNHIDGRIHRTKQDAERDVEDEEFGRHVGE
jgi:mannose-6-phosphate isomerase-like protein (cupin superfamily)